MLQLASQVGDVPPLELVPGHDGEEEGDAGEQGRGEEGGANPERLPYSRDSGGGSPQRGVDLRISWCNHSIGVSCHTCVMKIGMMDSTE